MTKYKNKPVEILVEDKLIKFSSILERDRYCHLSLLEKAKQISNLKLQPEYLLQQQYTRNGKKVRGETYIADFEYLDINGKVIVEDTKAVRTPLYRSKIKRLLYIYPQMNFVEVYRDGRGFKSKFI